MPLTANQGVVYSRLFFDESALQERPPMLLEVTNCDLKLLSSLHNSWGQAYTFALFEWHG